jgi:chorismate synthase
MPNSLGRIFTVTSFGESHGTLVGALVDGCPAGLPLSVADLQPWLDRRRPGQSTVSSARQEEDKAEILAGVFKGHSTGAPLCLAVRNMDADSSSYEALKDMPRPGHADYTNWVKYGGFQDYLGGGRASGRITAGWVMAGAVAARLLALLGVDIVAHTTEIGSVMAQPTETARLRAAAASNPVACGDAAAAAEMVQAIEEARRAGDSLGGLIEVRATGIPAGWGEPEADTVEGELARAYFAIPAVKGVEFGSGFAAALLRGTQDNDAFILRDGKIMTASNHAGGALGGITSGMPLVARLAIKPTPSIAQAQKTVNLTTMAETEIRISGRHDPCIVPRAVVVAEAMTAIVLCDFALQAGALPKVLR